MDRKEHISKYAPDMYVDTRNIFVGMAIHSSNDGN